MQIISCNVKLLNYLERFENHMIFYKWINVKYKQSTQLNTYLLNIQHI
jgi:hypothetical protein